jgi:hypothetical protein
MKAVGFHPSKVNRRPLFAVDGRKLGYVRYEPGGREVATDVDGRVIARIIKWKSAHVQMVRGACYGAHGCLSEDAITCE